MAKRGKGVGFLVAGVLAIIGAMALVFSGFLPLFSQFRQVAVHTPPGGPVLIEEPGTYTLWHDYRTTHNGTSFSHPEALPPGFGFEMQQSWDGKTIPLNHITANETVTLSDRGSVSIGRFELPQDGTYLFRAGNAAGDLRVFSLTKGSMIGTMGQFGLRFGLGLLVGSLGFVLVILGIVFMVTAAKRKPANPPRA